MRKEKLTNLRWSILVPEPWSLFALFSQLLIVHIFLWIREKYVTQSITFLRAPCAWDVQKSFDFIIIHALSFYVTKTVLVGPKWFWSDQIDLDLTKMKWSRPKWNGHDQNELVRSKSWFFTKMNHIWPWLIHFGRDYFIFDVTISFWS